ncbi:bifunctional demethylmenaquinone methyltransferase/2-methoxy-6-polyprenyl-1,4-benzoquinol methylase UbiE [Coxiella burnetii]|uniref:Ubiquinone/menaquinone biosynthesis C-methyltransferase UbiE n=1 Tax=Coxiella burnetii (strain RSA 331 / Henzerling II) TaxID=360115 RepID=UBIE_COXBR|nr:bifunctional demethylmenaquinone methyltransferase/2-methoxy-6-polyprenyl-1,4-benzoquinol methylase UbiE [Coxiella burnetii]A9N9F4.1 RecName: Full=Ubiquinone/menaquinone biosynthesis C-methyltransferase UbiE; AltName: Full=2-methoxy-6-polyprenyl-1,4-benzoquinol methylase; AltName: Full=Demethylmenaquinone methyltransferase [Coxiella burnetii RSA 331]ABX78978.1 ubiquinone/menaquinone biosynthesis methyltransferase ubiE [Coxiella burnetii RSA 331]ATN81266.1 bifunctional demethylmenaquinone meth
MNETEKSTHFGYQTVPTDQKTDKVKHVFESVAAKYDLMNDLMSLGIHRCWKDFAITQCRLRTGQRILDLAGGTGDLAKRISPLVGDEGEVVIADINAAMLNVGRRRLLDQGIFRNIQFIQADAEKLPFPNNFFDRIVIGFGLRNVTNQLAALQSMHRVIKPGGFVVILEFSKPTLAPLKAVYDAYSFQLLPRLGKLVAKDEESYRYLVESIRMHPDQEALLSKMTDAGFEDCDYHNLSGGIVAVHRGYKF